MRTIGIGMMVETISIAQYRRAEAKASKSRFKRTPKEHRTFDGIVFDSQREAKRYAALKRMERAGEIFDLVRQPKFPVEIIPGVKFCTYTADFSYRQRMSGLRVIEDVKSTGTAKDPAYRLRKKAAEHAHGIKVVEVLT